MSTPTEYGGYLPLELPKGKGEYYHSSQGYDVVALDCGRTAILFALTSLKAKRVLVPRYYCPAVKEAIDSAGYTVEYYSVGFDLLPDIDLSLVNEGDAFILVNYYGVMSMQIARMANALPLVIVDNCLAFFTPPLIREGVINVYSCRKFFGVADGAYAMGLRLEKPDYMLDVSANRALHLLIAAESGTNAGYERSLANERTLGSQPKLMSKLTHKILASIDYETVRQQRLSNYRVLDERLGGIQRFTIQGLPSSPHSYPLLPNKRIRSALVQRGVYIARYWEDWIGVEETRTPEWVFSNYMLCLPIDQRYSVDDMNELATIVQDAYERSN